MHPHCLMTAWAACQAELLGYLRQRASQPEDAEEVLQEVFIKAMGLGKQFCHIDNPRAWLFQVARHALADRWRRTRQHQPLPEDLAAPATEAPEPVDTLSQCLPRVLTELAEKDRQAITYCDIEGHSQQELATLLGLSLPGAKSRLQRARLQLKEKLETNCQVRFDAAGTVCCFTPRPPLAEP